MDAACALAMVARELYSNVRVFSFSNKLVEIPPRHGFALRDAIVRSQQHGGTYLGNAVDSLYKLSPERLIVITDEQSHDNVTPPRDCNGYMINVGVYKNGVGYGKWTHIDGFSESVLNYINAYEGLDK
jgi:hypothetical protein